MKFSALAFSALAAAETVQFFAQSDNDYNGKGLTYLQLTSGGMDYTFVGDEALEFEYDAEWGTLKALNQYLSVSGQYLVMSTTYDVSAFAKVEVVRDELQLQDLTWVCPVDKDPNGTQRTNLVYVNATQPFEGCERVVFRAEIDGEEPPTSEPPSSEPTPGPTDDDDHSTGWNTTIPDPEDPTSTTTLSTIPDPEVPTYWTTLPYPSIPTPLEPGYNTTYTLPTLSTTLTTFTTYCPTETTITLTTCGKHHCRPTTVTVTEPTTLTVPSCIPPETTTTKKTTTTSHSIPTMTNDNGGAANAVPILAGVAGLAALFV